MTVNPRIYTTGAESNRSDALKASRSKPNFDFNFHALHHLQYGFSLGGGTVSNAGIPGQTSCNGTISARSEQFGTLHEATAVLGFASVTALHDRVNLFCER